MRAPEVRVPVRSTRATPRWLLLLAAGMLLARGGAAVYEHRHPPAIAKLIPWSTPGAPLPGKTAGGAEDKRPVLYDYSADWCQPCKKMEREVFAHEPSARFIKDRFRPVRIVDVDESPAAEELRQRHQVTTLPTLVVEIPGKEPLELNGYSSRRRTMLFLEKALSGAAKPGVDKQAR